MAMRDGICPECGSGDIYVSKPPKFFNEQAKYGNAVYVNGMALFPNHAKLIHYVCASCQYIASYVADDTSMRSIKGEWTPISQLEKRKRKNDEG